MSSRRANLKRVAVWSAATALLLVWYMLSGPIIAAALDEWDPVALKHSGVRACVEMYFAPINLYYDHRELPGAETYRDYVGWCYDAAGEP